MEEKEEEKRAEVIREESSTEAPAIKKNPCNNNIFTIQSWLHFSNECTKMAGTWQRTCQYCDNVAEISDADQMCQAPTKILRVPLKRKKLVPPELLVLCLICPSQGGGEEELKYLGILFPGESKRRVRWTEVCETDRQ